MPIFTRADGRAAANQRLAWLLVSARACLRGRRGGRADIAKQSANMQCCIARRVRLERRAVALASRFAGVRPRHRAPRRGRTGCKTSAVAAQCGLESTSSIRPRWPSWFPI